MSKCDGNKRLVEQLDQIEKRVEILRQTVQALEMEKDTLVDLLTNFERCDELHQLPGEDREELLLEANRLLKRTTTVDVTICTPRNNEQMLALNSVNEVLDKLVANFHDANSRHLCETYLNACLSEATGPVCQKFQNKIIECTADDQKLIKKRLQKLLNQYDLASCAKKQRTSNGHFDVPMESSASRH